MRKLVILAAFLMLPLTACDSELSAEEYFAQGKQYFDHGNWWPAAIEFKNAVRADPENFRARSFLGRAYFSMGDFPSASKELDRALELGASADEVMRPLAYAHLKLNEHDEVLERVRPQSVSSDSEKAAMHGFRAMAYLGKEQRDAAKRELERARQLDDNDTVARLAWAKYEATQPGGEQAARQWLRPLLDRGEADAWSELGQLEFQVRNYEAAIDAYSKSIEARDYPHPDRMSRATAYLQNGEPEKASQDIDYLVAQNTQWKWVGVKHISGLIALRTQKVDEARDLFLDVLADHPGYAPSQLPLAMIEGRNNNLQSALSLLEQYTDKMPDDLDAKIMLADVQLRLNKVDKSQRLLQKLFRDNPEEPGILVLLGKSYLKLDQVEQAIDYFRKTIELDPKDLQARMALAQALLSQPSTARLGQDELQKILKIDPQFIAADMALFRSYADQKEFSKAREIADNVSRKHPGKTNGGNLKALTYLLEGDRATAIKQLESLHRESPEDLLTTRNLAKIYLIEKKFDEARALFISVLDQEPANIRVLAQLAAISAGQENHEETMKWLSRAAEMNPDELAPKVMLAAELVKRGAPDKADQLLTPLQSVHSENPGFILVMSQVKIAQKEFQQALRLLNTVPKGSSISVPATILLAAVYANLDDRKNLRIALEKILTTQPENFGANIGLARLNLVEGRKEEFAQKLAYLVENFPNHPQVLWLKSKQDSGDGNFNGAIASLNELMDKQPRSVIAVELARNQWLSGNRFDAISGLEVWQKENPDDISTLFDLAQYYAIEERSDEALTAYRKLVELTPGNPLILNNLAWLLKDSDTVQGINLAKKALEVEPDDASIMDTLAMLYLKNNEAENALIYSQSAAQAMPGADDIQLNHAIVLLANKQATLAQRILTRLARSSTSAEIARKAQAELERLK